MDYQIFRKDKYCVSNAFMFIYVIIGFPKKFCGKLHPWVFLDQNIRMHSMNQIFEYSYIQIFQYIRYSNMYRNICIYSNMQIYYFLYPNILMYSYIQIFEYVEYIHICSNNSNIRPRVTNRANMAEVTRPNLIYLLPYLKMLWPFDKSSRYVVSW